MTLNHRIAFYFSEFFKSSSKIILLFQLVFNPSSHLHHCSLRVTAATPWTRSPSPSRLSTASLHLPIMSLVTSVDLGEAWRTWGEPTPTQAHAQGERANYPQKILMAAAALFHSVCKLEMCEIVFCGLCEEGLVEDEQSSTRKV